MTVKPKLDKKALKEAVRLAQLALSAAETAERFPSQRRKCKYCGTQFNTPATYNGQQMRFCTAAHRKAFDKEGEKPIDVILRKQENRMRKIARDEASALFDQIYAPEIRKIVQDEIRQALKQEGSQLRERMMEVIVKPN